MDTRVATTGLIYRKALQMKRRVCACVRVCVCGGVVCAFCAWFSTRGRLQRESQVILAQSLHHPQAGFGVSDNGSCDNVVRK